MLLTSWATCPPRACTKGTVIHVASAALEIRTKLKEKEKCNIRVHMDIRGGRVILIKVILMEHFYHSRCYSNYSIYLKLILTMTL